MLTLLLKRLQTGHFSDKQRRKLVVFKVDYESDVELVLEIMKNVAVSHKDVLKDPEPLATFQGFGDNYLEFKLYFWLIDNLIEAHSEISISIYKELKKAGGKNTNSKTRNIYKKIR